jgi:predicted RNA-binding protein associated with RNAse of E/G family
VNLQTPLERTRFGFRSTDQFLDIVVAPDLSWRWKDEDELAEAVDVGRVTPAEASAIRSEGERVVADIEARSWPFDGSMKDWRPDPAWGIPAITGIWNSEDV